MAKNNSKGLLESATLIIKKYWYVPLILFGLYYLFDPIKALFSTASQSVKSITDTLGLTSSAASQAVAAEEANNASPFSPQFYKNAPAGASLLTNDAATQQSQRIHDDMVGSFGLAFSPDFNAIMGEFQQLHTQSQVSYLCDIFQQTYNADLVTWLDNPDWWHTGCSADQMALLINYVKGLPQYN